MIACHFLKANWRADHGHEDPWRPGEKRSVEGEVVYAKNGYHFSLVWEWAISEAKGPVATIVEVDDDSFVSRSCGIGVSRSRRLIAGADVSRVLLHFAADMMAKAFDTIDAKTQGMVEGQYAAIVEKVRAGIDKPKLRPEATKAVEEFRKLDAGGTSLRYLQYTVYYGSQYENPVDSAILAIDGAVGSASVEDGNGAKTASLEEKTYEALGKKIAAEIRRGVVDKAEFDRTMAMFGKMPAGTRRGAR
jgi:hypothetical protein